MMKRVREALARLSTRSSSRNGNYNNTGSTRDLPSSGAATSDSSLRLDRVGRTSSVRTAHHEKPDLLHTTTAPEAKGPVIVWDGTPQALGTGGPEDGFDVIFVHDLNGHRVGTWTKGGVCWPRDLLGKDVPDIRIISWGWTAPNNTVSSSNKSSGGGSAGGSSGSRSIFVDQAESLLVDVAKVRKNTTRPVIFVGHGIGGLVVKEALVTAAMSRIYGSHTELGNVYPRTVGVLFLGTPHRTGSGKRSLGECVALAAGLSPRPPSSWLMQALREASVLFETLHATWLMISRDIRVVNVREELPIQTATGQLMVPRDSIHYEGFNVTRDDMSANHMDLARFTSGEEPGYQQLVAHLRKIASGPTPYEILSTLYFDTMQERESLIDDAYGETCEWILSPDVSPFQSWLNSPQQVLWISGRAGSGKSTLMKHIFRNERVRQELADGWARGCDLVCVGIFLFEGGSQIQKTHEGLLRSMLYQVLSQRPELIRVAFPSFFHNPWPPAAPFNTVTNLNQGLYALWAHMSDSLKLCIFLDGLDEYRIMDRKHAYSEGDLDLTYSEGATGVNTAADDRSWGISKWTTDSHTEIARLVNSIASKDNFKVVCTSRELPVFQDILADVTRIRMQEHTESAITLYIQGRLQDELPGLPNFGELCRELASKSKGDILWARLAIDMVIEGSLRTLRATLDSLPTQLGGPDGLYMRIIESLPAEDQRAACRIFSLVTRAMQPPSILTLAFADEGYMEEGEIGGKLKITGDNERPIPLAVEDLTIISDGLIARLAKCCVGFLEAETADQQVGEKGQGQGQRVVFMHQTAKEWVARDDIWQKLPAIPPSCRDRWLLIANAMRYSARIDAEVPNRESGGKLLDIYCSLLDELDRVNQQAWVTCLRNHRPLYDDPDWYDNKLPSLCKKHWAGYEPMVAGKPPKRKGFLSLAVQASLVNYVSVKLKQQDPEVLRRKAQELLVYVVSPKADGFSACVSLSGDYLDFHHDMPDTRLLEILLDAGADVRNGEAEDGSPIPNKVWVRALKTGKQYFSRQGMTMNHLLENGSNSRLQENRQRWVAALRIMLQHGADPNVEVGVRTITEETSSTTTLAAVDLIRETLDGEPEYAVELAELEALMGRRGSVGIAR